jgi:hypothetical protein
MTEQRDPNIRQVLERWQIKDEAPAWEDVLARAELTEPTARGGRFRRWLEPPRRLNLAIVLASLVAATAPALAIVAHRLLMARSVPGTTTTTHVALGSGRSVDLHLSSRGSPLERDSTGFHFLRPGTRQARFFRWTLELHGLDQVARARIHLRGRMIRLCHRCGTDSGLLVLWGGDALALLNGQATLAVGKAQHRVAPAAGGRLLRKVSER